MSFLNVGFDGPPNHNLEIEGDMFVSNVEDGTYVPVDIRDNVRLRIAAPGAVSGDYRVTDLSLSENYFGISAPGDDVPTDFTTFCIDENSNVGIGTVPTKKLDVSGSLYETGSLTCDSNLITGTLTVGNSGTISCSDLEWGATGDIHSLMPSGAIMMTTLTTAPTGWEDVTDNFIDRNVLLQDNQASLGTGGNNDYTIVENITHNHNWSKTHNVNHNHNWNDGTVENNEQDHTHPKPIVPFNTNVMGNHYHSFTDQSLAGDRGEANYNTNRVKINFGINPNTLKTDANRNSNNIGSYVNLASGNHSHASGTANYNYANQSHNHQLGIVNATNGGSGGGHTHSFNSSGLNSPASFSILPHSYGLRFIKKN